MEELGLIDQQEGGNDVTKGGESPAMEEQGLIDQQEGGNVDTKGGESPAMEEQGLIDENQGSIVDSKGGESPAMEEKGLIDEKQGSNVDTKGRVSPAMEEKGLIDEKEGSNVDTNGRVSSAMEEKGLIDEKVVSNVDTNGTGESSQAIKLSRGRLHGGFTNAFFNSSSMEDDTFSFSSMKDDMFSFTNVWKTICSPFQARKTMSFMSGTGESSQAIKPSRSLLRRRNNMRNFWAFSNRMPSLFGKSIVLDDITEERMEEVSYEVVKTMSLISGLSEIFENYTRLNSDTGGRFTCCKWLQDLLRSEIRTNANKLQCYVNGSEQDKRRKQRRKEMYRQCKMAASFRGKRKCYTIKQV